MSNENSNSEDPKPEPKLSEPELNVPEPPPPADIGGSDVSTHSEHPDSGNSFITEDVEKKND